MPEKCPFCGSMNTSTAHLLYEYKDNMRACFDPMFGHNCRKAQNQVANMLLERGTTHLPNIFGPIPITNKWGWGL
jgi:hypothetical protein